MSNPSEEKVPLLNTAGKKQCSVSLKDRITSCRWQVGYTICLIMSCTVLLRMNMSMVIVCMNMKPPNMTVTVVRNGTNVTVPDPYLDNYVTWDSQMEGLLISGYYIGVLFTSCTVGAISGLVSGKKMIAFLTLLLVFLSVITPTLTFVSEYLVLVLRILVGVAAGGIEPCATQIQSDWAPLPERSQMMVLMESANSFGGIGNFLLSGIICSIPVLGGWPFIFYIFGGINILSLVVWVILVYDTPAVHPRITPAELAFINSHRVKSASTKKLKIPWRSLLTSKAVWGCIIGFLTYGTLFVILAVCLPLYLEQVLLFDATVTGLVSALAFIGRVFGAAVFGYLADWLFSKRWLSIGQIRKTFQVAGLIASAPFLVWLGYLNYKDQILSVVMITIYWFLATAMNSGFRVNVADVAPRYAGLLNGISIMFVCVTSAIAPAAVALLTPNGTAEEWRVVFFICVGVSVVGAVLYLVLASGEEQDWAKDPDAVNENVIHVIHETDNAIISSLSFDEEKSSRRESESNPLIPTRHKKL